MEFIGFSSEPKKTPFAPEWQWLIFQDTIVDVDFAALSKFVLDIEPKIIKNYPPTSKDNIDGYTNLGPNSLTSRYGNYNFLELDHKEIPKLFQAIKRTHSRLLSLLNLPTPRLRIQCWANVLRNGEKIDPHLHNCNEYTYLSGHITVQCNDTSTVYINPINQLQSPAERKIPNQVGSITLFQSNIPHYTTVHNGKDERITVAFDIIPDEIVTEDYQYQLIPFT